MALKEVHTPDGKGGFHITYVEEQKDKTCKHENSRPVHFAPPDPVNYEQKVTLKCLTCGEKWVSFC